MKWINPALTAKFFPSREKCSKSTFGCFLPWCQYDCLCWLRKIMFLDVSFNKWKVINFICGYGWCFWFVPGNCKWLLPLMISVATQSLNTSGNQLYVLILVNTWQVMLKVGNNNQNIFHMSLRIHQWKWKLDHVSKRYISVNLFICSGSK